MMHEPNKFMEYRDLLHHLGRQPQIPEDFHDLDATLDVLRHEVGLATVAPALEPVTKKCLECGFRGPNP